MKDWRSIFPLSREAVNLEEKLLPKIIEHAAGLKSTANTDVKRRVINLNTSQSPLKTALSYTYELKNLENAPKYATFIQQAKQGLITKAQYIKNIIRLEAEAAYFRCLVFRDFELDDALFPSKKDYLVIYDNHINKNEAINALALFIQDHGIVRGEYAAKKYYADSYDHYTGKRNWPGFYDEVRQKSIFIVKESKPMNADNHNNVSSSHAA